MINPQRSNPSLSNWAAVTHRELVLRHPDAEPRSLHDAELLRAAGIPRTTVGRWWQRRRRRGAERDTPGC
ncbi:MAG: hypothetical protein ABI780_14680 [Ardenticatenales bacterium]